MIKHKHSFFAIFLLFAVLFYSIAEAAAPLPTVTITANDATATEAGPTTGQYTVTRTGNTASALTVYFGVSGTAAAGSDYMSIGTSVTIPKKSLSATITVTPVNDTLVESDETVAVTVSANAAYTVGSPSSATVTITSDDVASLPAVTISANDATATESGPTTGQFTVTRTGSTTSALAVYFAVSGTATSGSDYNGIGTSVSIPAGSASALVTVTPVNDTLVESDETVAVTLSANAAYTVGSPSNATVTITSDDVATLPTVTITANDATATEAGPTTGQFSVTRTGSTTSSLTVYFTASGTATSGTDYTSIGTSMTIASGSASAAVTVTPINDTTVESDETVVATLSSNAAYTVGSPSNATVTITSDDGADTTPPTGSITINGGATYANTASVTLTLSALDNSGSVSQMCISNAGSCTAWETYGTTRAWTLTTGDGTKTVYVWYKDNAGNTSASCSDTIILDTTPPSSSIIINNNAAYTNTTSVTLTLSATDTLSGVSQMCLSNTTSCTAWETYATSRAWTLTTGDGTKTVYVWYKDNAGNANISPYSDIIILDMTAPTNGTLSATAGNAQISLSWSGFSDATSGIGSYKLVYSTSGAPSSCSTGTQIYSGTGSAYTHTTLTNGATYYYRVCAIDNAQNTSSGATASATPVAGTVATWSMSIGSVNEDRGQSVVVDDNGDVIMTGYFAGTVDFGGGALTSNVYPWLDPNQYTDIFVVKYAADGNHVWSRRIGGVANDRGLSVAVDSSGDVVVSGYCANPVDFGNGVQLSGSTGTDIFVAKYSGADGSYEWARRFGGTSDDYGYGVTVDGSGNILVTGQFQGTVDFGGGALVSAGSSDIFIAKYTATGAYVWAKRIGGTGSEYGYGTAVDNSGNVIVIGRFSGSLDLGSGAVSSAGGYDSFVAKYSGANGSYQWSRVFGSTGYDYANGVAVDGSGNVLVTGQFQGTVNFGGSALTSAGGYDIFMAKYSGSNGSHVWSQRFGSTSSDYGNGIAVDEVGNVIMTGAFYGTVDFGGGLLVSSGIDVVVAKYTSSGGHMWSEKFGGTINQFGDDVAVKGGSNIAIAGYFENVVDFGYGSHTSLGAYDIFLATIEP